MSAASAKNQAARALRLTEVDNIVVAVQSLTMGQSVQDVMEKERVPRGYKMAMQAIARVAPVVT